MARAETERGLTAYQPSGGLIAKLDLVDKENGNVFEVKTGWQESIKEPTYAVRGLQSERLSSLVGTTIALKNPYTWGTIEGFQVTSVTYISVARGANLAGFGEPAYIKLYGLGINTMTISGGGPS